MSNTMEIRVGLMPGKLVQIVVEEGTTARELFEIAEVEISNSHEIRIDGVKVDIDSKVYGAKLCVGMKQIKGNK